MKKIEIFIVDRSYLAREGLKNIIAKNDDFTLIGEVDDSAHLSGEIVKHQPDVLIVDFTGRLIDLEDIGTVLNLLPHTKALAITAEQPKSKIMEAIDAGITSYVLKDCSREEIIDAIYNTARGKKFFCTRVMDKLVSDTPDALQTDVPSEASCDPVNITHREIDIIKLIARGNTNKQIAAKLFLSTHTVNTHRKNIMSKLGVNNTAGIVMYAVKENMISPGKFRFSISN